MVGPTFIEYTERSCRGESDTMLNLWKKVLYDEVIEKIRILDHGAWYIGTWIYGHV